MLFLMSIQLTTEAAVSINRVQTFLLMDENEPLVSKIQLNALIRIEFWTINRHTNQA